MLYSLIVLSIFILLGSVFFRADLTDRAYL